jgi:hypothetical protein
MTLGFKRTPGRVETGFPIGVFFTRLVSLGTTEERAAGEKRFDGANKMSACV